MGCMMATSSSSTERTAASSSPRFRLVESFSLSESKKALPRLRYFALSSPLLLVVRSLSPLARLRLAPLSPAACLPARLPPCTCTASWSCRNLRCVSRAGCSVRRCRCCRCYGAAHAVAHLSPSLSLLLSRARRRLPLLQEEGALLRATTWRPRAAPYDVRAARALDRVGRSSCRLVRERERAQNAPGCRLVRSFVRVCAARC